ncbi:phosphotransferase [Embleya sp. NPDC050154]|uniref:phosphotransferase n=1 Tax=Embleya sp. NPDC050154 TaxID=3363988 RepID=UPI00379866B9
MRPAPAAPEDGLSPPEIDVVRHLLGMAVNDSPADFPYGEGLPTSYAEVLTDAYESAGLGNFPLSGRPPVRGAFSTGVVALTTKGYVVGQRTSENYRPTHPVLQAEPIVTTPQALRIANGQRPGLTPRLFHHEDEKLIVTSFEFGTHPRRDRDPSGTVVRRLLLQGLPQALTDFTTIRIPREVRRHQNVDSTVAMIDRARTVRRSRFSEEQLRGTATFGIDDALLDDLGDRAAAFTPRTPGILHNDLHYDNMLVRPVPRDGRMPSRPVCLLDLQFVTEGDPVQDLACAAVKLDCTRDEVADLAVGWARRLDAGRTSGIEHDLPAAMAAVSATQSTVLIPNVIKAVREAAERDRSSLEHTLDEAARKIQACVAPAMEYGRDARVTTAWVRDRLGGTLPRNPAMIPVVGFWPVTSPHRASPAPVLPGSTEHASHTPRLAPEQRARNTRSDPISGWQA